MWVGIPVKLSQGNELGVYGRENIRYGTRDVVIWGEKETLFCNLVSFFVSWDACMARHPQEDNFKVWGDLFKSPINLGNDGMGGWLTKI